MSARVTYTLTPRMFTAVLVQYQSASSSLTSSARFRWEYQPGSDLFIVHGDGRDSDSRGFPALANRSFVVKVTRLLRFSRRGVIHAPISSTERAIIPAPTERIQNGTTSRGLRCIP